MPEAIVPGYRPEGLPKEAASALPMLLVAVLAITSSALPIISSAHRNQNLPATVQESHPAPAGSPHLVPWTGYQLYFSQTWSAGPLIPGQVYRFGVGVEAGPTPPPYPPYNFSWVFPDGTTQFHRHVSTEDYANYSSTAKCPGVQNISVFVNDSGGGFGVAEFGLFVGVPFTAALQFSSWIVQVNGSWTVAANWTGSVGATSTAWNGLPPGCASAASAQIGCRPAKTGEYHVGFVATDARGCIARADTYLAVTPPPQSFTSFRPGSPSIVLLVFLGGGASGLVTLIVVPRATRSWLERTFGQRPAER